MRHGINILRHTPNFGSFWMPWNWIYCSKATAQLNSVQLLRNAAGGNVGRPGSFQCPATLEYRQHRIHRLQPPVYQIIVHRRLDACRDIWQGWRGPHSDNTQTHTLSLTTPTHHPPIQTSSLLQLKRCPPSNPLLTSVGRSRPPPSQLSGKARPMAAALASFGHLHHCPDAV